MSWISPHISGISACWKGCNSTHMALGQPPKNQASLPAGWYGQVPQVLRMCHKGAKPTGTSLSCTAQGVQERVRASCSYFHEQLHASRTLWLSKSIRQITASPSLVTPEKGIFLMFHQTSKWREGWKGWSASLSSRAMEPLTHKLCYSCREEKLWATLAETLAVHHCLQLEFLLRAFTNDNLGQE